MVNHLRGYLGRAFNAARRAWRYPGPNPVRDVRKRRVPKRKPDFLRAREVPLLLRALSERWRPRFAAAIYTGLRKGELLALRKSDVDLERRMLTDLARSAATVSTRARSGITRSSVVVDVVTRKPRRQPRRPVKAPGAANSASSIVRRRPSGESAVSA